MSRARHLGERKRERKRGAYTKLGFHSCARSFHEEWAVCHACELRDARARAGSSRVTTEKTTHFYFFLLILCDHQPWRRRTTNTGAANLSLESNATCERGASS